MSSTTGIVGMWNGTRDGERDGFVDYSNGSTNCNDAKMFEVEVFDIRKQTLQPSLKSNGHELVKSRTSMTTEQFLAGASPEGKAFIEDVYFKEVEELLKKMTGSQEVYPYTFRVREQSKDPDGSTATDITHAAVPVLHIDRDVETATGPMKDTLGEKADGLQARYPRWAQINVWRPVGDTVHKWPLCFVNHSSVPGWNYDTHLARIFSKNDPRAAIRGQKGYDSVLKHDPRYTYHYAKNLDVDEALVFCSFDSDVTKVTPHGAFWDKSSLPDLPTRRSIEVRSWVFFEEP